MSDSDTKPKPKNPAMEPIESDPNSPDVLLIGDSISIGYTVPTRELLAGKANVYRPPANCGPTIRGVQSLDSWLGGRKWDVIHFNWGLHDLRYQDENGQAIEPSNGRHQVPIDQYEKNLEDLVQRLEATGAKLIWASTTPVPDGADWRVKGDEVKFNAVAEDIMKAHGIEIDDLYSFALACLAEIVHFTPEGSRVLAEQVAASILGALD